MQGGKGRAVANVFCMRFFRRVSILATFSLILAGTPAAGWADGKSTYVPEFVCQAAMSTPGVPGQTCQRGLLAGYWHIDLRGGWALIGSYTIRVEVPDGRYVEQSCRSSWVPLSYSETRCSATSAGLGDEGGGSSGVADGIAYLHVALPIAGTVTVRGGEGNGFVVLRGARTS